MTQAQKKKKKMSTVIYDVQACMHGMTNAVQPLFQDKVKAYCCNLTCSYILPSWTVFSPLIRLGSNI